MNALKITGYCLVALVVGFFSLPLFIDKPAEQFAQQACEERIRLLSKNPETVRFGTPAHQQMDKGRDRFAWIPSSLQMQNGFGAMMGATATCIADRKSGAIVEMTID